ncbi:MAG: TlyA family RNA methyltransferase [bacterium]|nr:TlyA family RNA methyltransferase [bacterium]
MKRKRLDDVLITNGHAGDKNEAFIIVTEGRVFVNGQRAVSPAQMVREDDKIEVKGGREYVGRGAYKLDSALAKFDIDVHDKVCADIGSATGGFVEVLLKRGAAKVYAVDTARGKLDIKLREDKKVVVMEGTDVRGIESFPESIDFVSGDVSLISLKNILPHIKRLAPKSEVVVLFKPQYEARDPSILKHGVIKDDAAREALLKDFQDWLKENAWEIKGLSESPIRGSEGNVEYLFYLK